VSPKRKGGASRPARAPRRKGEAVEAAVAAAFAPATVANVAVGFDVLGFALEGVGDAVTVARTPRAGAGPAVRVESVEGDAIAPGAVPLDPDRNTAAVALAAMVEALGLSHGFTVTIRKGIPLSSGMGGSAASAVGAVAANALLDTPLSRERLLAFALAGEAAASGAPHADNVVPCLYGGLTAVVPGGGAVAGTPGTGAGPQVVPLPVPAGVACVLVRPHLELDTRRARAALAATVPLKRHVEQSALLAGFVAGCFSGDLALVSRTLRDVVVEPQRAALVPGFAEAREAALGAGALGCSLSGSGPSVFAWVASAASAEAVKSAVRTTFAARSIESDAWVSVVGAPGARVVETR
jgi:homoserine kinase